MHLVPIIKKTLLSEWACRIKRFGFAWGSHATPYLFNCQPLHLILIHLWFLQRRKKIFLSERNLSIRKMRKWEEDKATNCHSCRSLRNEKKPSEKKTYPEKDHRKICKWQYAADQRTFNATWKPYARLS